MLKKNTLFNNIYKGSKKRDGFNHPFFLFNSITISSQYITEFSFVILDLILCLTLTFSNRNYIYFTCNLENGASLKAVQKKLGQSNINTTLNVHSHLTEKVENKTVDII